MLIELTIGKLLWNDEMGLQEIVKGSFCQLTFLAFNFADGMDHMAREKGTNVRTILCHKDVLKNTETPVIV